MKKVKFLINFVVFVPNASTSTPAVIISLKKVGWLHSENNLSTEMNTDCCKGTRRLLDDHLVMSRSGIERFKLYRQTTV